MRGNGVARRLRRARGNARGFTLIEAAMATVIIGVGVVAVIDAQRAFVQANLWSSQAATATLLANEIRELTRNLPRHDPVTGLSRGTDIDGNDVLIGWGPEPGEVIATDFDDLDDFDGLSFGMGGDLPGPINAVGDVIPEIDLDGDIEVDGDGDVLPMQGWTQSVTVWKVSPFNTGAALADDYFEAPSSGFRGRRVDEYPLRVEVTVFFQGLQDDEPTEVTRVAWIVP